MKKLAALLCLLSTASIAATATVAITSAISITAISDLNFGNIIPSSTAGTVLIESNTSRTSTGGVTPYGDFSLAAFQITSDVSGYVVMLNFNQTITATSGSNSMTINLYGPCNAVLIGQSQPIIYTQGRLNVAANQPAGNYVGTFTITASYYETLDSRTVCDFPVWYR